MKEKKRLEKAAAELLAEARKQREEEEALAETATEDRASSTLTKSVRSALPKGDAEREDDDEEFDVRPNEEIEKDYYGGGGDQPMMMVPPPGPTTWDELDAEEIAEDQAEAVQEATWDARELVRNILYHPEMNPDEKSAAIAAVGEGFAPRVNNVLANAGDASSTLTKNVLSAQRDMDVLQLESILAQDSRSMGIAEKVTDLIKRKLSYGARQNLSAGDFALPEKKKYPIHDKAHVRNALARAAQQIQGGGAGAADAKAALPKIRAAAKKFGIGVSTKSRHNAILVEKDASGQWRAVLWVTNNFIDSDKEIIAEDAHKEYVKWLDENPDMTPAFVTWHTEGTARKEAVDFWAYENGFLIMSAPLTESEASQLLKSSEKNDLGMSHGSLVFARDPKHHNIITKYRMYEVSDLPLENAANPFTAIEFDTMTKEVEMDKLQYLAGYIGEAKAKALLEKTGLKQKELQEAGVKSAEASTGTVEQESGDGHVKQTKAAPAPNLEQIAKAVGEHYDMEGLNVFVKQAQADHEELEVLKMLVKDMAGSEDDRLAEKLTPPVARFAWSQKNRASESEKTKVSEEDPLKKSKPIANWLSAVTGTEAIAVEEAAERY